MPVMEFVQTLNGAIAEHLQHQRLLFCDSTNIRFGKNNVMDIVPVPDGPAQALLETDRDQYMELQVGKLLENSLNRKVAKELLRLKCGTSSTLAALPFHDLTMDDPLVNPSLKTRMPTSSREDRIEPMGNHAVNLRQLSGGRRSSCRVLAVTSGKGGRRQDEHQHESGAVPGGLQETRAVARCGHLTGQSRPGNERPQQIQHLARPQRIQASGGTSFSPAPRGLRIICGASGLDQLADISEHEQHRLLEHLSGLQDDTDVILVDTAAGIASSVVSFCMAADQVLVVTTPEAAAMTDAYGMIKVLVRKGYPGPISVVVNMAHSIAEGKRTYQRLADVAGRFLQADLYYAGRCSRMNGSVGPFGPVRPSSWPIPNRRSPPRLPPWPLGWEGSSGARTDRTVFSSA